MKLIIHKGGKGSGNYGHAGRPGKVGGSSVQGLVIGKNTRSRRTGGSSVELFGLPYDEKKRGEFESVSREYFARREYERSKPYGPSPLDDYNAIDHTKSYATDPNAGFASNNPLANPSIRIAMVNEAVASLSYSNIAGYGAALRDASRGNTDTDLYKHFSKQLPNGVTLEDVNAAVYAETQGILDSLDVSGSVYLYHGTNSVKSNRKEYSMFDIDKEYTGFSSWSKHQGVASGFGSKTVFAKVPIERLFIIPAMIPRQLANVPSFLGGGRDEGEYAVLSIDGYNNVAR